MYDIRQFRPSLYLLLFLGISGFALAAQSPGIWVLGTGALLLNGWLVQTGRFRPLPRFVANAVTLIAVVYVYLVLRQVSGPPILVIGQFLVLLQLVKLYEQRGNRDYAQLLVLSLLLMVAAAISTATLAFGSLFVAYLFVSLYCCLLFHLKVETDHAKAAIGLPEEKLNPMTLRQDQRYLARSMRRLTALVSACAVTTAVLVFLFFPRNTGAGILGPLQLRPQTLTGFSDKMSFQQVAQITQNAEVIGYVKAWRDGLPVAGTEPMLLRGVTLDVYTGSAPNSVAFQWLRINPVDQVYDIDQGRTVEFEPLPDHGAVRQEIMLQPTGTDVLFASPGVSTLKSITLDSTKLRYLPVDRSVRSEPAISQAVRYEVVSSGRVRRAPADPFARDDSGRPDGEEAGNSRVLHTSAMPPSLRSSLQPPPAPAGGGTGADDRSAPAARPEVPSQGDHPGASDFAAGSGSVTQPAASTQSAGPTTGGQSARRPDETGPLTQSYIDREIAEYARRPEVSGSDSLGPLAPRRPEVREPTAMDIPIAQAIERHLTGPGFRYTLDLSDAKRVGDRDPIVAFLFDLKRGHCEYFAGAMTLLCQSLGLQARVVIGFKCDEYNPLSHSYVVRQSHAHAWVEVLDTDGNWITFDPTSGRNVDGPAAGAFGSMWKRMRQVFDYLEYAWASSIVAYDRETRSNVITNLENSMGQTANAGSASLKRVARLFQSDPSDRDYIDSLGRYWLFSSKVIAFLIGAMLLALLLAIGWFVYERWKIRRRARRIGLGALPRGAQFRLARQLGFYDDLMRLLARHRIVPPPHLTPREFSESLSFLPADAYDRVGRLTGIFYRVRYGGAELTVVQRRRLQAIIHEIEAGLHAGAPRTN